MKKETFIRTVVYGIAMAGLGLSGVGVTQAAGNDAPSSSGQSAGSSKTQELANTLDTYNRDSGPDRGRAYTGPESRVEVAPVTQDLGNQINTYNEDARQGSALSGAPVSTDTDMPATPTSRQLGSEIDTYNKNARQ